MDWILLWTMTLTEDGPVYRRAGIAHQECLVAINLLREGHQYLAQYVPEKKLCTILVVAPGH